MTTTYGRASEGYDRDFERHLVEASPSATPSPTSIRKTIDDFGKRLRRRIAAAESNEAVEEFLRHCLRGTDVGGNA